MTDYMCAACGLRVHRYSPNFPGHEGRANLMGCVNSLRGEVERLEAELAQLRASTTDRNRHGRQRRAG